jgi:hypothetical protein
MTDDVATGLHIRAFTRGRWSGSWGVFNGDERVSERPLNEDEARAMLASLMDDEKVAQVVAEEKPEDVIEAPAKPAKADKGDMITLILNRDYWPEDDMRVKAGEKMAFEARTAIKLVSAGIAREESIAD